MRIDINKIDRHIVFLDGQAKNLLRTQQGAGWAVKRAQQFQEIVETLRDIRRQHQMRTMSGGLIEDEQGPAPYRFPTEK